MAESTRKPAEAPKPGDGAQHKNEEQVEEPETYTHEALIEGGAAWFGYSPHLVAGALSGERKKHLTIEEAAKLTKEFAERPIEMGETA